MNYDLVIATTTCFKEYGHVKDANYRRNLYLRMCESLEKSDRSMMKVCHRTANDDGIGWNENYRKLLGEVKDLAPLCLIADSDAYFHPQWLYWLDVMVANFPDASGWALYRSPRLKDYLVKEFTAWELTEYRHAPPHGLCFRTADYIPAAPGEWFESFISKLPERHGTGFIVPKVSMIQHTGMYGLNNLPGHSEDFDPLFPFNHECGLDLYQNREHNPTDEISSLEGD